MSNVYHILYNTPTLELEDTYVEVEKLARQLVQSGRMRIDGDIRKNFVPCTLPFHNVNMMFSYRELTDAALLPLTKSSLLKVFKRHSKKKNLDEEVNSIISRLQYEVKNNLLPTEEVEMKIARALTQATHPVVMQMLIWEEVEVFVSYGYNIGDLLDLENWEALRNNSGLQSTYGRDFGVFVSCGGDPFFEDPEQTEERTHGNGFPALARLMVIAAQEIGHYSDIIRNVHNQAIDRHSANIMATRAKEHVRLGRIKDIEHLVIVEKKLKEIGVEALAELEKNLQFYRKNKRPFRQLLPHIFALKRARKRFISQCKKCKIQPVTTLKDKHQLATNIQIMIRDMLFNLSPQADVYKRDDPKAEEAIACVEALARVPQQAVKWGHRATAFLYPHLYVIYYREVIPAMITSYRRISGKKFRFKLTKPKLSPLFIIKRSVKRLKKHYTDKKARKAKEQEGNR